jgi:glycosyltransferase involved in cell wall biosynthesis
MKQAAREVMFQMGPRSSLGETKISVAAIIPLYNGAPFIREALESVLAQTEPADEIIVVDDGSTDDGAGAAIVQEMAKHHPIQLLTKANGGQSSARNLGIAQCTSSHIALLDQDDIWYEDHLAILKQPFVDERGRNLGLVFANLDGIDRSGRLIYRNLLDNLPIPHPRQSLKDCLAHDLFILPGASLFTKEAFERVGGFDERLSGYEDDDFFLRMFVAGYDNVYLKDKSVLKWRIYSDSTSYSPRMAKSRMIYFDKLLEAFPDEPVLHHHWTSDAIGPRFFELVRNEFMEGSRLRDTPRLHQAWSDFKKVLPFAPRRVRRRMRLVRPLIEVLYLGPLHPVARLLFRYAAKSKNKRR